MIGAPRAARWRARRLVHTQFLVCAGERPDGARETVWPSQRVTLVTRHPTVRSRETANGRLGSDSCRAIARKRNLTVWLARKNITKSRHAAKKEKYCSYPTKRSPLSRGLSPGARAARTRARFGPSASSPSRRVRGSRVAPRASRSRALARPPPRGGLALGALAPPRASATAGGKV